jgi:hypothetical protein
MNLEYRGSVAPGETVVLTVRTVRMDAHEQRVSCQINGSVDIVVSDEAILSIPLDQSGLNKMSEDRNGSEKGGDLIQRHGRGRILCVICTCMIWHGNYT